MKVTITFDDTNPTIVAALGKDVGILLAEQKGYQTKVHNTEYVPAVGSETIDDETKEPTETEDGKKVYPQIPNPDYVAAKGETTIDNTETRAKFIGRKTLEDAILPYLTQGMARAAQKEATDKVTQINTVLGVATEITTE